MIYPVLGLAEASRPTRAVPLPRSCPALWAAGLFLAEAHHQQWSEPTSRGASPTGMNELPMNISPLPFSAALPDARVHS
jgi:hypothetical protein